MTRSARSPPRAAGGHGNPHRLPAVPPDMTKTRFRAIAAALLLAAAHLALLPPRASAGDLPGATWRYYRPGNTGIQGDYNEAIWIGPDGDPWIGGYDPGSEEGGVAKLVQAENRWINFSNVDYPVIGHPDLTGTTRVSDIVADAQRRPLDVDLARRARWTRRSAARPWSTSPPPARRWPAAAGATSTSRPTARSGSRLGVSAAPRAASSATTPATADWHYWTGGSAPQGGNDWPQLVWNVAHVSIQPKPGGGYIVWADSDNSAALVSFDSDHPALDPHEFELHAGLAARAARQGLRRRLPATSGPAASSASRAATRSTRSTTARPAGDWVSPPQLALPAIDAADLGLPRPRRPPRRCSPTAAAASGASTAPAWEDLGIWGEGTSTDALDVDSVRQRLGRAGPAARRSATLATGLWQRYRVTNSSQYDSFNTDSAHRPGHRDVYACANAGPGVGGMTKFDGVRWTGFNNAPVRPRRALALPHRQLPAGRLPRRDRARWSPNPTYDGLHQWDGTSWTDLGGADESRGLVEDSTGRLWSLGPYFDLRYFDGSPGPRSRTTAPGGTNLQRDPVAAGDRLGQHLRRGDPHRRRLPVRAGLHAVPGARPPERHLRHRGRGAGRASPGSARPRGCSGSTPAAAPTSTSPRSAASPRWAPPARRHPGRQALVRRLRPLRHGPARPGLVRRRAARASIPPRATAARSGAACRTPRSRRSRCASSPAATSSG